MLKNPLLDLIALKDSPSCKGGVSTLSSLVLSAMSVRIVSENASGGEPAGNSNIFCGFLSCCCIPLAPEPSSSKLGAKPSN